MLYKNQTKHDMKATLLEGKYMYMCWVYVCVAEIIFFFSKCNLFYIKICVVNLIFVKNYLFKKIVEEENKDEKCLIHKYTAKWEDKKKAKIQNIHFDTSPPPPPLPHPHMYTFHP